MISKILKGRNKYRISFTSLEKIKLKPLIQCNKTIKILSKDKQKHSYLFYLFMMTLPVLLIASGCSKSKEATTIEIEPIVIDMDVNDERKIPVILTPEEADISELVITNEKELIATIEDGHLKINTDINEGSYKISISNNKISDTVTVNVVDEAKRAADEKARIELETIEKQNAEDKLKQEAIEKAQDEVNAHEQQLAEAQEQENELSQIPQINVENQVYIASSGNGKKYHNNPKCSNMKGTILLDINDAMSSGYSACKKCY